MTGAPAGSVCPHCGGPLGGYLGGARKHIWACWGRTGREMPSRWIKAHLDDLRRLNITFHVDCRGRVYAN